MIEVVRETKEAPASVQERLRSAGGVNRYGEPMYRVVWGWNRLSWMGGKWEDRDEAGTLIREVVQLREEPKYFWGLNRWHVEKWVPPELYGSPRAWLARTLQREDGISIPALGPYPERGEYEHSFTIEGPRGEFVQLTPAIVEAVVRRVEFSRTFSMAERRAHDNKGHDKADRDYKEWAFDVLTDGERAFGGRPTVSVA